MASNKSSKVKVEAEKLLNKYNKRLLEIRSLDVSELTLEEVEALCSGFESEMKTIDSTKSSILPVEIRASLKHRYSMLIQQYRDSVQTLKLLIEESNDLNTTNISIKRGINVEFIPKLLEAINQVEGFDSYELTDASLKQLMPEHFSSLIQRITKQLIENVLPNHFRDSIILIRRTLAEVALQYLQHLVMCRETAEKKIELLIKHVNIKLPRLLERMIVQIYESLVIELKAEILKLRTYPIPEPWGSHCMRKELTQMMKGEFIFFVHPGIEEDMRPLKLSDRDLLPGGLTRQVYNLRMNRVNLESTLAIEDLEVRNMSEFEMTLKWFEEIYETIEKRIAFTFTEFPLLYRDNRTLEFLVNKNNDDDLLNEIYQIMLRRIRHYYNNRIDIPSLAISINNNPLTVAPPKQERNIPIASGVDRGALETLQLNTPSSVIVERNSVVAADSDGHYFTWYRARDLEPCGGFLSLPDDTPLSLTIFREFLYVCYYGTFMQCRLTWRDDLEISNVNHETTIPIERCCCTASNNNNVFVGTLTPSIMLINTDTLKVDHEIPLNPLCYQQKNRYPWLQDMKAGANFFFCLFTGSPYPLQMFSLEGELIRTILTENQIMVAYNFNVYFHPIKMELMFYICDFWDNDIKVFDYNGKFIESFCEKGIELCQLIHPTAIFIEHSGYITICDMKEDNCVQRL